MSPTETIRVWTIQPLLVWERLQKAGSLLAKLGEAYGGDNDTAVKEIAHYRWLIAQLSNRQPRCFTGKPFWWAWTQKPDLRSKRHCSLVGTKQVRIEVELSVDSLFVMPSWAWNHVVFNSFLAMNADQARRWRRKVKGIRMNEYGEYPRSIEGLIEKSWERLFDPKLPVRSWRRTEMRGQEAVFELLNVEDVRNATHFVGTNRIEQRMRERMKKRGQS